jgi:hypothetical protein
MGGITPESIQSEFGNECDHNLVRDKQLAALAKIFDVSVDYLVGQEPPQKHKGGLIGRTRRAFEQVSKLPRSRQQYILRVVEDLAGANGTE